MLEEIKAKAVVNLTGQAGCGFIPSPSPCRRAVLCSSAGAAPLPHEIILEEHASGSALTALGNPVCLNVHQNVCFLPGIPVCT